MARRHDSASEITLPKATALLTPVPALRDEGTSDDVTVSRPKEGARWHIELELDRDQIARLYRLGLAHGAVVWREGLPDWRPLLDAHELREAIEALKARAPSSMKSALRRATLDRIANLSRPNPSRAVAVSPRKRMATDPALRLYAALNRRRSPPDSIELAPTPKITVAPAQTEPPPLPRDPTPVMMTPPRQQAPKRGFSFTTVIVTSFLLATAAMLLTAGLFWFGPLRAARDQVAALEAHASALLASARARALEAAPALGAALPAPAAAPTPSASAAPAEPTAEKPVSVSSLPSETAAPSAPRVTRGSRARSSDAAASRAESKAERSGERGAGSGATGRDAPQAEPQSDGPNRAQIARALAAAASNAASCGVSGSVRVVVVFGPSGVVRRAGFEGPLPEHTDRSCVLRAVSRSRIPPFSGEPVTVRKTISF